MSVSTIEFSKINIHKKKSERPVDALAVKKGEGLTQ